MYRLQLSDEACLEVTKPRTGCERLEAAQGIAGRLDGKEIGLPAKVVIGGLIRREARQQKS